MPNSETIPCTHCGLPAKPPRHRREGEVPEVFCCGGCCLAHHLDSGGVSNSADRLLSRVLLSAMLSMAVMMLSLSLYGVGLGQEGDFDSDTALGLLGLQRLAAMLVSAPVLMLLGLPLAESVIRMRRWLSADALVLLGTGSAWLVSGWNAIWGSGEVYFDTATMVLVLVSLGRWLDLRAKQRAREELSLLLPERSGPVQVLRAGLEVPIEAEQLQIGDLIRLRPGDVLPVDGWVRSGTSFIDMSNMTGEAEPRRVESGSKVLAGCTLIDGSLEVESTAVGADRVCAEVERLLQEALAHPSPSVRLADRVAGSLIPVVILLACGTAIWHWEGKGPEGALLAALSVVLIACPCSLGIATPLAYWTAMGEAWKRGVLVRGGEAMERLGTAKRIWLDKTGTLTDGHFNLTEIRPRGELTQAECLRLAGALEHMSEHPIGRALYQAWAERRDPDEVAPTLHHFRAIPGVGVQAELDGQPWSLKKGEGLGVVELFQGEQSIAEFVLHSTPRPEAGEVVRALKGLGLNPSILTGDGALAAERLAEQLNLPVESDLLPGDKLERLGAADQTIFVGDGLNDAAALARASVGISVAGGATRSMDAASINLLRPGIAVLPDLIQLARQARAVARWNLFWAFGYNGIGLLLAISGQLTPILAAGAMVASSVAVVLHSSKLKGTLSPGEISDDGSDRTHTRTKTQANSLET